MAADASRARGPARGRELARGGGLSSAAAGWRRSIVVAATAIAVTRLVLWAVAIVVVEVDGLSSRAPDFDPQGLTSPSGELGNLLLAPFARWDSVWFLSIARDGYQDVAHTAFFPLYPLLARGMVAAILVSLVAALLGLAVVHRLAAIELDDRAATGAVWLLACFPASFFLTAIYSEGLFLALSAGAVLAARSDRWAVAGVLGALAAATRSAGVVLLVPLALLWWSQAPRRLRDAAWLALVPAGLAAFCVAMAIDGHGVLAPFHAQEAWFREFAGPFVGLWDGAVAAFGGARQLLSGSRAPVYFTAAGGDPFVAAGHNLQLFAFAVAAISALVGTFRRLPLAYGAYALAALALPLSWPVAPQPLMSFPRFLVVLFPLFIWLGWWSSRRRGVLPALAAVLLAIQAVAIAEFATWHWFA